MQEHRMDPMPTCRPNEPSGTDAELAEAAGELRALRIAGIEPYPYHYAVTHAIDTVRRDFARLQASGETVAVASRILAVRRAGRGMIFWDLAATVSQRRREHHLQVILQRNQMDANSWAVMQAAGLGDWVGVAGVCVTSRTGEPSLAAAQVTLLSKALRPLPIPKVYRRAGEEPGEAHTVADAELLWRMPEVDMITRRKADLLVLRSRLLSALRQTLQQHYGCIEIETPYLNPHFGGAEARPFTTWVHALGQELYVPVSPEIELKRAVVGGIGSGGELGRGVYAIARNFRNEALDRTHHPEFTSLEVYIPFVDYEAMMEVTERLFADACCALYGSDQIDRDGVRFDFSALGRACPWQRWWPNAVASMSCAAQLRPFAAPSGSAGWTALTTWTRSPPVAEPETRPPAPGYSTC